MKSLKSFIEDQMASKRKPIILTNNNELLKKRKQDSSIVSVKYITNILGVDSQTKLWLVEWSDMSRTWLTYHQIKEQPVFQVMVEQQFSLVKIRPTPSYIN